MAPPVTLIALLIALALVPGWFYLRLFERIQPPGNRSGLHQLIELVAVGAATTGLSALILLLVPHRVLPFTLDVDAWAVRGGAYIRVHVQRAALSVVLVFLLAMAFAYFLYKIRARRKPASFLQGSVWVHSLGQWPQGKLPWVGIRLTDGRLVNGLLHTYTTEGEEGKRDVALARPVVLWSREGVKQDTAALDRLIVNESKIEHIVVIAVDAAPETNAAGRVRRAWRCFRHPRSSLRAWLANRRRKKVQQATRRHGDSPLSPP